MDNLFDSNNTIVSWADEACQEPKKRRRRGRVSIQEVSDIHKFTARLPIAESITKANDKTTEDEVKRNVWTESPGRLKEVISGTKVPMGSVIQVFQDTPSSSVDSSPKEPKMTINSPVATDFWKKKDSLREVGSVKYRNFNVRRAKNLVLDHLQDKSQPDVKKTIVTLSKSFKEKGINTEKYTNYGINQSSQCSELPVQNPIIDDYVWVEKFEYNNASRLTNYIILLGLSSASFIVGGLTVWLM